MKILSKYEEDLQKEFPNRYEDKKGVLNRRNKRVEDFFRNLKYDIRLIGNPNNPAIILNEKICLSCFVHNFDLNFTNKPFNGEIIKTFKLMSGVYPKRKEVEDTLNTATHREAYKIKVANSSSLFLSGYNFLDVEKKNMYPVFSKYGAKIYLKKETAEDIIEKFKDYNLEID